MTIRTGIAGFGMSAQTFHIPFIRDHKDYRIEAVSTSRAAEVPRVLPDVSVVPDAAELCSMDSIDLLIITSPNESHYPLAKAALEGGKHVLIEKPMTVRTDEARELVKLAEKKELVFAVYHNRRWDADFLTLRDLLAQGSLGTISHFESHYDRFRPVVRDRWREKDLPGAGLLYDLGSHLLDQALFLFGMPDWILADMEKQRPGAATDDYVHLLLAYGSMRCELHIGSFVNGPVPRFAVHGDGGSYISYGMDQQENQIKAGMSPSDERFGMLEEASWGRFYPAPEGSPLQIIPARRGEYRSYHSLLADSINKKSPPPVSGREGLNVMIMIEAALESAAQGRKIRPDGEMRK